MKLLLDTNIIIWLLADDPRMTAKVLQTIESADEVYYSAASIWEIAIKAGLGKIGISAIEVDKSLHGSFIKPLAIQPQHVLPVQSLPRHHADPFDRLLIAQAIVKGGTLLTGDKTLKRYDASASVVRVISDL